MTQTVVEQLIEPALDAIFRIPMAIAEIVVDVVGDILELVVRWHGGDHTRLTGRRIALAGRSGARREMQLSLC